MYAKLSWRNAKRQSGDYMVYFMTMILSVSLMYAFNALVFSKEINDLSGFMRSMPYIIISGSLLMVLIIGWLVFYTMGFMLKKRSREFGLYILLGMESPQVATLFLLENSIIGGLALLGGIFSGAFLYQIFRASILSFFKVAYTFQLRLSLNTILITLFYFLAIYFSALLYSIHHIKRRKIQQLLYWSNQNENPFFSDPKSRKILFVFSLLCGVTGLFLVFMGKSGLWPGIFILSIFIFTFFICFSSALPTFFNKHPQIKWKKNTLFVFRCLTAKVSSTSITLAVLCVLFVFTFVASGFGLLFNQQFQRREELTTRFDLYIGADDPSDFSLYQSELEALDIKEQKIYPIYQSDSQHYTQIIHFNFPKLPSDHPWDSLIKFSDYQALRKMLGYKEVTLSDNSYILHTLPFLKSKLHTATPDSVRLQNQDLILDSIYTENLTQYTWNGNGSGFILVVPDRLTSSYPIAHTSYAAMLHKPLTLPQFETFQSIAWEKNSDYVISLAIIQEQNAAMSTLFIFPLFYLSVMIIIVAATILSVQFLSDIPAYKYRYQLLSHLGMDKNQLCQTIRQQFLAYYLLPVIPSVLIGMVILRTLSQEFDTGIITHRFQIWGIIAFTIIGFLALYFVYIAVAYTRFKSNVLRK